MAFPLSENMIPEEILAYQASEDEQKRADELAEKNKAGTLTPDEREELQRMLQLDAFVAALKAPALETLDKS